MNSEDGQVYSVCILKFSCFTKYNRGSQNINKQNVNIADENLTEYSFLSRYHYTKSKNYLKRWCRIRHWIPMFIGTPCTYMTPWPGLLVTGQGWKISQTEKGKSAKRKYCFSLKKNVDFVHTKCIALDI